MKKTKAILIGPLVFAGIALTSCDKRPFTNPDVYGPAPTSDITDEIEETSIDPTHNLQSCVYGPAPTSELVEETTIDPSDNLVAPVYGPAPTKEITN